MKKWFRTKHAIILHLNNGTLQVRNCDLFSSIIRYEQKVHQNLVPSPPAHPGGGRGVQTDAATPDIVGRINGRPVPYFAQQHTTTCTRVCKRTQYVTSINVLNVGSCWPTRLRAFALGFRLVSQMIISSYPRNLIASENVAEKNNLCRFKLYLVFLEPLNSGKFIVVCSRPLQNVILGGSTPYLCSGHQRNVCTCRTVVLHIEPILQDTFRLQFHSRFKLEESRIVLL